jgi:hypothetical protein
MTACPEDPRPCVESVCNPIDGSCGSRLLDGVSCGDNAICSSGLCRCNDGFIDCDGLPGCECPAPVSVVCTSERCPDTTT